MGPERQRMPAPTGAQRDESEPAVPTHWDRDDDELLLLDELEESDEAPDDERDDQVM